MMEIISLLLPTRQRPQQLSRLIASAKATATHPDRVETVVYVDDDDPSYQDMDLDCTVVTGPRYHSGKVNLSIKWNRCYAASSGDILMHCGDDIVFQSAGWDDVVRNAFEEFPDRVLFAFGRDGYQDDNNFGTHGFISREWVETVGFFVPPYFVSDYNDTWLNAVAELIGRHREIDIYTEHLHWIVGKSEKDLNTLERLERHERDRPDLLYQSPEVQNLIVEAAERLRGIMCAGQSAS